MNILILGDFFSGLRASCAFRVRSMTAERLAALGHNVTYVYPGDRPWPVFRRISPTLRHVATPGWMPRRFRTGGFGALDTLVKTLIALGQRFDVVHVTSGHRPAQYLPSMAARLRGAAAVCEWWEWHGRGGLADTRRGLYGKLIGRYDARFELPAKRYYEQLIAISSTLKERFRDEPAVYERITVLWGGAESGVDLRSYPKQTAREQLGVAPDLFIFGMSNLHPDDEEDNLLFLHAFDALAGELPQVRLLVTGSAKYVSEVTATLEHRERIIYPGWLDFEQYGKYLSCCDVFVLPLPNTRRNAGRWPNKIGDYLSIGRPVLTNPTGDVAVLFRDKRVGVLCEYDGEAVRAAMVGLAGGQVDLAALCADSQQLAREDLSFDGRVEKMLGVYARAMAARRA